MHLSLHSFTLKLRESFRISYETRDQQEIFVVQLSDEDARGKPVVGWGESTENKYYGVSIAQMQLELSALHAVIEGYEIAPEPRPAGEQGTPEHLWQTVYPQLKNSPFALCALDMAAHDLYGKKVGQPLYQLWGLDPAQAPASNYTIGIDRIEVMVRKLRDTRWPIYKIKLGTSEDLGIIRELRKHTNAVFRVDANCAWGVEETIRNAHALSKLGVEFIEQPLPADNLAGMKELMKHSVLPLVADESCITEGDVAKCVGHFHGVNVKLTKCGGITPARRMVAEARQHGLKVMVGCMTESTIGISAIAHLAPLLDYVDMDGALLLAEDIATGVTVTTLGVEYPPVNGTGVTLLDSPQPLRT